MAAECGSKEAAEISDQEWSAFVADMQLVHASCFQSEWLLHTRYHWMCLSVIAQKYIYISSIQGNLILHRYT